MSFGAGVARARVGADVTAGRTVVGVDASAGSGTALEWAIADAQRSGGSLEVVHAWELPAVVSPIGAPGPVPAEPTPAAAETLLDNVMDEHRVVERLGADRVAALVVRGEAAGVLLQRAEGAEQLVVGTRGHGVLAGLLLGSVSLQCVHHAPGPVTVVPAEWMPAHNRVVVGVDGSEGSVEAFRWAAEQAGRRSAKLTAIYAWQASYPGVYGVAMPPLDYPALEEDARRLLAGVAEQAMGGLEGRPAEVELLPVDDSPRSALTQAAQDADLLVVGSRGRGGFAALLLGSVSHYCVHHAGRPVTVVPHAR